MIVEIKHAMFEFALFSCIGKETVLPVAASLFFFLISSCRFYFRAASIQEHTAGYIKNQYYKMHLWLKIFSLFFRTFLKNACTSCTTEIFKNRMSQVTRKKIPYLKFDLLPATQIIVSCQQRFYNIFEQRWV